MRRLKDVDSIKEQLKANVPIVDVAQKMYGNDVLSAGSDRYKTICPFHEDTDPSMAINNEKGVYYCHGCKAGGDIFEFVMEMESISFMEAIERLAEYDGFDLSPFYAELTEEEKAREALYALNAKVAGADQTNQNLVDFVTKRVLDWDTLQEYGVGWSNGEPKVGTQKQRKDLSLAGDMRWKDVVVIPLKDPYGRVAGFRTRPVDGERPKMFGPPEDHPLDVPEFYGLYEARRHVRASGYLILVEGEIDVWQMAAHGFRNTAAMMGTKITEEGMKYLYDHGIRSIVVVPDGDKAGRKFAMKLARSRYKTPMLVKIANIEDGDPDEILMQHGAGAIDSAIRASRYTFEYLIDGVLATNDITRPTAKVDVLMELRQHISSAPEYERDLMISMLSEKLGMEKEGLYDFFRENSNEDATLHNLPGERIVLRRMLEDEQFIGEALLGLRPEDFHLWKHRRLFSVIDRLYRTMDTVSPDNVITWLTNHGEAETADLTRKLMTSYVDVRSAPFMLNDLRDKAIRRNIQHQAKDVVARLSDTSADAKTVISDFSAAISRAIVGQGSAVVDVRDVVKERMAMMHERIREPNLIVGMDLGPDFPVVNHTLHGAQGKRYHVIGGPSGCGKTALACMFARRLSVELGEPGIYLTFETGRETLTDRIISSLSGVESDKIITGYMKPDDIDLVHEAAARLAAAPLKITERGRTIEEAEAIIRHDVLQRGIKYAVIDYIQLMGMDDPGHMKDYQMLGEISRRLLELSHELGIHLFALAQMNREGVKGGGHKKEDVGGAYKIAQDADIFAIIREKTKEEAEVDGPEGGNRFFFIDKHRHGRDKVGSSMMADLAVMRIKEVRTNS